MAEIQIDDFKER